MAFFIAQRHNILKLLGEQMKRFLFRTGIFFLLLPMIVLAEEQKTYQMQEVEVVASPVIEGNSVNAMGSSVTTVSKEQLDALNAQDLPSALRKTPGVVISRHNPVGSFGGGEGGAIFIRGQGSSRPGAEIQMNIDGIPKFVSVWTHPLMDVLSVDIIDHIDVYKSAQPVLFGNMAFGAIQIHTKRQGAEGFTTMFNGAYGSDSTWIEVLEHGGKIKDFDYYLVQSYRKSDGHRDNADGELQNYFGRLGYDLSENWNISLTFNRTDNRADDPGTDTPNAQKNGTFGTDDNFSIATLSNRHDWGEGYVKLYAEDGNIDWVGQYNSATKQNDSDTLTDYNNYGFRIRETLKLWKGGEILAGLDIDRISGEVDFITPPNPSKHFDKETFRLFSPYMAVSHRFDLETGWYLIPSAGLRYFEHSEFDSETGPQAGLVLGYKATELNMFYSRGVNYPGMFAKVQDVMFMPGENLWQDLSAETLNHFEIGISHAFSDKAKADITYFKDEGKNRIVTSVPPPAPPVWENIGEFDMQGIEASVILTPISDLSLFAGFTYLDANPSDLPYCPELSASLGAIYRLLEHFSLSLDALYVDEQFVTSRGRRENTVNSDEVDSYFLLNGKIAYDYKICDTVQGQIYLSGENLTDTDYEQKKDYPMPGISGMMGVKLTF